MIVTIHVDDALTNNEVVEFLLPLGWDMVTRRASFLDTLIECTPINSDYDPEDVAALMRDHFYVGAEVIDVEY